MQILFNIDPELIIEAAAKMLIDNKLRLYGKISEDIYKSKFETLLDKFKNIDLTDEQITKEVEFV
jgi:hypothetical protein